MVNNQGEIKITETINGTTYLVISSEYGNSKSVWSAIDTIKSSKGGKRTMTRLHWKKYFDEKLSK